MPHRADAVDQTIGAPDVDRELDWRDDVLYAGANMAFSVPASDLGGGTGQHLGGTGTFEGVEIFSLSSELDRGEAAIIGLAQAALTVYAPVTSTEDGTVRGAVEISNEPDRAALQVSTGSTDISSSGGDFNVEENHNEVLDSEIIGRPLDAVYDTSFFDAGSEFASGGAAPIDDWQIEYGVHGPGLDFSDELFVNGFMQQSKVDDHSIHMDVSIFMLFQVVEFDDFPHL